MIMHGHITGKYAAPNYLHIALFAACYFILQLLSTIEFNVETIGEIIWLPSGIATVTMLLYGWKLWPGIFIGSITAFMITGDGFHISAIIDGVGNTIGPLLGYWFLAKARKTGHFDQRLERTRDVWYFFLFAAFLATFTNALVSSIPHLAINNQNIHEFLKRLVTLWMPYVMGVSVISPVVLMMITRAKQKFIAYQKPVEFLALVLIFTFLKWQAWHPGYIEINSAMGILLMIPFFVWSVTRLGQRATALLAVSIFIIDVVKFYQTLDADFAHTLYANHTELWQVWVIFTLFSQLVASIVNQFREMTYALSANESRLRISQQYGGVGTWEIDLETSQQIWSENCWSMLGITKKEIPTLNDFIEAVYPDDRDAVVLAMQQHINEGLPYNIEYRINQAGESIRWMRSVGKVESNISGQPRKFRGIVQDITESKAVNQSLQESEYRYRTLMADASDAILICDLNGDIEEINRSGEKLLGYSNAEIQQMNIIQIQPLSLEEIINITSRSSNVREKLEPLELTVRNKNGKQIQVEARLTIVELDGRRLFQGVLIDLTERKRLEKEHAQAEAKHRSVLVREVHHRIKNNLQGVTGILRQYAESHPEVADPLDQAIGLVQSVAVVHGLQGRVAQSQIRLCELASAISQNNQNLWRTNITLEIPAAWTPSRIIESETVPIALILNELIANAVKHALPFSTINMALKRESESDEVVVVVKNSGHLSSEFNINKRTGLGTGIELILSLMPRTGAELSINQIDSEVVAELRLIKPVIFLESNSYETSIIS